MESSLHPEPTAVSADPILAVEGLRKVYRSRRRGDVVAVEDVSFAVEPGEIVGLLGPNGAGKTTTIKCAATLVRPSAGRVRIGGVDALRHPRRAVEGVSAVLEGNRNVYWRLSCAENLEFFGALQGIPARRVRGRVDGLLERFGLSDKRTTPARMLSKGMQQKLALACAFVKESPLLLLDEPTLGLDVEASYELRGLITGLAVEEGRTVLLSSHDMAVVQDTCERVVIIQAGRVVTDDKVANLIELFKARAYRFTLADGLSPLQEARLREAFPLIGIVDEGGRTVIEVEFPDGTGLYRLMDVLRDGPSLIESIDRQDPNLEEIFLKIVKGEVAR